MEEQLKQKAKARLFEDQFAEAFNKYITEKREGINQSYADKRDWKEYRAMPLKLSQDTAVFAVEGDDGKFREAKWNAMLKDCAFYFDNPSLEDEHKALLKLQQRYDDLFASHWKPPLQSRRDLVTWACEQRNAFMQAKEAPEDKLLQCENYGALLDRFGPNYESLKKKLGYVRGLFD